MLHNDIKISVLIPCYNVERYVAACLESAIGQTLRDTEILCINDGSTDSTLELLRKYEAKDSRIVVIDKPNAGYGHTMNVGIKRAQGKYIAFLESDDYIVNDAYENLYNTAEQYGADIIKGNYYEVIGDDDGIKTELKLTSDTSLYNANLNPISTPQLFYIPLMNWLGLFRTRFLRENGIVHNETPGASHQDVGFWFLTFTYAKTVYLLNKPFYCYRKDNPNSSMHDRRKVYNVFDEYEYAREIVKKDTRVWESVKAYYWHRYYLSAHFAFLHIDDIFKRDFINVLARDFRPAIEESETCMRLFKPEELETITEIVKDPEKYYFTKIAVREEPYLRSASEPLEYICAISVIIPVYNTAPYLAECMDSVLSQSFRDIEVICVDDDSTDDSLMILLGYERRDHRVQVLRIPHGGQSAARNRALCEARGRYIYFMDSDDLLSDNAFETMFLLAEEREVDVLYFDGCTFFENETLRDKFNSFTTAYTRTTSYSQVVTGIEMFTRMRIDNVFFVQPCLQLIRHEHIRSIVLRFYEGIIYEDNIFCFECMMRAKNVSHENIPLFYRRIRESSTMTSVAAYPNFYGYFVCWVMIMSMALNMAMPTQTQAEVLRYLNSLRSAAIHFAKQLPNHEIRANIGKDSPFLCDLYYNVFQPQITERKAPSISRRERVRNRLIRIAKKILPKRIQRILRKLLKRNVP